MDTEGMLSTLAELFAHDGAAREVAVLAQAEAEIVATEYDNWNGGTHGFTIYLKIPSSLYVHIYKERESCERDVCAKAKPFFTDNEWLKAVSIAPIPSEDNKWREKAKAWLAGTGVTNQGRVRSNNIASRECDGLLFRSQQEIHLYRALK